MWFRFQDVAARPQDANPCDEVVHSPADMHWQLPVSMNDEAYCIDGGETIMLESPNLYSPARWPTKGYRTQSSVSLPRNHPESNLGKVAPAVDDKK